MVDAKEILMLKLKRRLRWHHIYFLLAFLGMIIIVSSLLLQHTTLTSFVRMIREVQVISEQQDWLDSLRGGLLRLNAPGNDVFQINHNVAKERERFIVYQEELGKIIADEKVPYKDDVRQFVRAVGEMGDAERKIFDFLDKKTDVDAERAAAFMAVMDQHQAVALRLLDSLSSKLREDNNNVVVSQHKILVSRRKLGLLFAVFVFFAIFGIIYLGRRMHIFYEEYVAQQRRAAQDLRIAMEERNLMEERFKAILENAPDAIIIVNQKREITIANLQAEKMFGYSRQELTGKPIEIFLPDQLKSSHAQHCDDFTRKSETRRMGAGKDLLGITKDGRKIPLEISLGSLKTSQGSFVISTIRDITDRKANETALHEAYQELVDREKALRQAFNEMNKAQDELNRTQNQLAQSEKMASLGQLAAGVAHEINNPLGFIGNNVEILGQYIADYAKVLGAADKLEEAVMAQDLGKAKSVAEEMSRLKEDVNLNYITGDISGLLSHTQSGVDRIKTIVMDLRTFSHKDKDADVAVPMKIEEAIDGVLNIVRNEIKYKAELKMSYGETPLVRCNPQRLGQVFINLLVNAGHAIERRGTIEIKTYRQDNYVCVDVADTGKGIEEENLIKIFDPFFTTKPVGQGTGLGLSVSHEIIKKYGGQISVRSKVGEGTTFTVMLPILNG